MSQCCVVIGGSVSSCGSNSIFGESTVGSSNGDDTSGTNDCCDIEQISLPDNSMLASIVVNTSTRGIFTLHVESVDDGGATAIFNCKKSSSTVVGSVNMNRTRGTDGTRVKARWSAASKIEIFHSTIATAPTGGNITYNVTVRDG